MDEAFLLLLRPAQMGGQELERYGTVEFCILGLVDGAHTAAAELFEDLVMMDSLANHLILPDLHI